MERSALILMALCVVILPTPGALTQGFPGAAVARAGDDGVDFDPMVPDWARDLPFPPEYAFDSTFYAEVNGLPVFIASGATRDDKARVMKRVREAFPDKDAETEKKIPTFATGETFWQVLGLKVPSKEEAKEAFDTLAKNATGSEHGKSIVIFEAACVLLAGCALEILLPFPEAKRVVWRTALPILVVADTMCELLPRRPSWCYESDPIQTLQAIMQLLPQLRWHTVTLQTDDSAEERTTYRWMVWNGFAPEHLFAIFDPRSARTLCDRSTFSWPDVSECTLVARFLSDGSSGLVDFGQVDAPLGQVEAHFTASLRADGWEPASLYPSEAMALVERTSPHVLDSLPADPGFQMWRRGPEEAWVALSEAGETGSQTSVLLLSYRGEP